MKLERIETQVPNQSSGRETKEKRAERIKAWFALPENKTLVPVGQILKAEFKGKTLAAWLLEGETLELPKVGKFELVPEFKISLDKANWLCPACKSAHGTGIGVSPREDEKLLSENQFFYRPASKTLVTISLTCFDDYVRASGLVKQIQAS